MLSDLFFRLRSLLRRSTVETELDEELRFHLEQQVEKRVRAGLTREEALRQTRLEFGALALLLATIGLYGVTAYTVVRRIPEIGIRMALGAGRGGVIAMVLRGALQQTAVGLAIGDPSGVALRSVCEGAAL